VCSSDLHRDLHEDGKRHHEDVKSLREMELPSKVDRLTKWVYTGIGVCLVAGLLATALFKGQDDVRQELSSKQERLEIQIERVEVLNEQLDKTVAVMEAEVKNLHRTLDQDRKNLKEYLGDLKDIVVEHIKRGEEKP